MKSQPAKRKESFIETRQKKKKQLQSAISLYKRISTFSASISEKILVLTLFSRKILMHSHR